MNEQNTNLDEALGEITAWRGDETSLWETALAKHERSPARIGDRLTRALHWNVPMAIAASIAIVLATATLLTMLTSGVGRVREQAMVSPNAPALMMAEQYSDRSVTSIDARGASEHSATLMQNYYSSTPHDDGHAAATQGWIEESADRMVVKKATIELETSDVRSAFLKAALVLSEVGGEYVEQSSLTGEGATARANLTLRIAASRLDQVLNALRDLASVRSENINGEDVTAHVVDLEARLRNEQRVEKEMLELLERRNDAPLNDILQLRSEIARVRQTIEQITAQQQRLSRLVSLATVLVIIRAEPEKPAPKPVVENPSLMRYFGGAIKDSWQRGAYFLADTLAGLLGILVGGAVWWMALLVALLTLRQHLRRRAGLA